MLRLHKRVACSFASRLLSGETLLLRLHMLAIRLKS
jgi:hypothetical protein